jgi:hypothetical protein
LYVNGQNTPGNNLGMVGEAETGEPSQSQTDFETKVKNDLTAAGESLIGLANVEPCMQSYSGYNANCVFQGYVNLAF